MEEEEDKEIKIITLGDKGVGKTSIIKRIKDLNYNEKNKSSDYDIFFKYYETKYLTIKFTFYDIKNQEAYQNSLNPLPLDYIKDSHIVILVFSNIDSLNNLKKKWYKFYKENTTIKNPRFILIGNISDISEKDKYDILKLVEEFSEEIDAHFLTCSENNNDNIDNIDNIDNVERYIIKEAKSFINREKEEKECSFCDLCVKLFYCKS